MEEDKMSKVIVTGVDGNFGGYVARNITQLKEKEDLIFTCPFEEGLKEFKDTNIDNFYIHSCFSISNCRKFM